MRRTMMNIVLFLFLFAGINGVAFAMSHNDYEGCAENCEQRLEAASLNCLAETIYYEAGNQIIRGKLAVAFVVMNRSRNGNKTICEVVEAPGQFCWVKNKALRRRPKNTKQWEECLRLAKEFLEFEGDFLDPTNGAISFRRPQDAPFPKKWKPSATIGGHIFYVAVAAIR